MNTRNLKDDSQAKKTTRKYQHHREKRSNGGIDEKIPQKRDKATEDREQLSKEVRHYKHEGLEKYYCTIGDKISEGKTGRVAPEKRKNR